MTTDIEQIQREMKEQFARAGLLPFLVEGPSEVYDLGGELFAEIVLSDRAKLGEATDLMRQLLHGRSYSLVVRPKWTLKQIGEPAEAYGQNGQVRAAVLIPVILRSGSEEASATVAVTTLAAMEFDRILGRKADLRQVAKVVMEGALRRGGRSYWDPIEENYLEVASGAVANIVRLLKQPA